MIDRRPLILRADTAPPRLQELPDGDTLPADTLGKALEVLLAGLVTSNNAGITEHDTVLQAFEKLQAQLDAAGTLVVPVVPDGTTSRAVGLLDVGSYLRFEATGAKFCSFDAATGFTADQEIHIANRSDSGNVTLIATGITLNPPKGGTLKLEPGDTATVKFISTISADVFGSTEAAP